MVFDLLELNGWLWLIWSTCWFAAAALSAKTKTKESFLQRQKHILPTLIAFALIFNFFNRYLLYGNILHSPTLQLIGVLLTAAGLIFALWARVSLGKYWSGVITLKVDHKLIRTGAYQYVRHPIYTGLLTATIGSVLCAQTVDAIVGVIIIFTTYFFKLRREEDFLTQEFGSAYRDYQVEVPRLLPRLVRTKV